MIIDIHSQVGKKKGLSSDPVDLLPLMDKNKIDKSVIFSFPENVDNQFVFDATNRHPDRFIGFATINPWNIDAEEQLSRCFNEYGFKGLWLHPIRHGYAMDDYYLLDPLLKMCSDLGKTLLGYGAATTSTIPNHFEDIAIKYPDLQIVIAHMGYMYETNAAMVIAKTFKNVYLEIAGVLPKQIQKAIKDVGANKVIYGSNSPYEDMGFSIEKVHLSTNDELERCQILGENTLRLLQL